jgi:hypothetical protein
MLDRLATLARGLWVCIKALLHSFEQMLMLPSRNPSLWPCRALRFKRTGCGPVPLPALAELSFKTAQVSELTFRVCPAVLQPGRR